MFHSYDTNVPEGCFASEAESRPREAPAEKLARHSWYSWPSTLFLGVLRWLRDSAVQVAKVAATQEVVHMRGQQNN